MTPELDDARSKGLRSTASIDRQACMGSGNCLYWAPEVFDLDDDGIAVVIGEVAENDDRVQQAATNCPTGAIRIGETLP
ncbi:MAG: ferredoxin [Acidimicrobiales bacterium]|jgi:ferredoxin